MSNLYRSFEPANCGECPVREQCAAGRLVEQVEDELFEHAKGIHEGYAEDVAFAVITGEFEDLEGLTEDLLKAQYRADKVSEVLADALELTANLSTKTKDSLVRQNYDDGLEQISDILGSAPHPTETFKDEGFTDVIETASKDIARFASQGICLAVESVTE